MSKLKSARVLPAIHDRAAGIDIGSRFHVVAVPVDLTKEPVRTFQTFTADRLPAFQNGADHCAAIKGMRRSRGNWFFSGIGDSFALVAL